MRDTGSDRKKQRMRFIGKSQFLWLAQGGFFDKSDCLLETLKTSVSSVYSYAEYPQVSQYLTYLMMQTTSLL